MNNKAKRILHITIFLVTMVYDFFLSILIVDRLQSHWEDSQTKLSDRTKQLHNMLQDSTDWLDAKKGVDHLIKQASERLESWQEVTYTVEALKRQNTELKVGLDIHSLTALTSQKYWHSDCCFVSK